VVSQDRYDELLEAFESGQVVFPYVLLTGYKEAGLSDEEALVLLHVLAYQQIEHSFPSLDDLVGRTHFTKDRVASSLQRFIGEGFLQQNGQRVSIRPLLKQVFDPVGHEQTAQTLLFRFEQEFGRLLSPLEYEQVMRWHDEDRYPEWLILEALRESVLAGVFNFRYVDKVLRDWTRARVSTERELAEYRSRRERPDGRSANAAGRRRREVGKSGSGSASPQSAPPGERVVPAAQPGKYSRFYQLYGKAASGAQESAASRDET
jgi:DNA replication protein